MCVCVCVWGGGVMTSEISRSKSMMNVNSEREDKGIPNLECVTR